MKHFINAEPRSEEFRKRFAEIRDSFLSRLEEVSAKLIARDFRACDISGKPIAWVWNNDTFRNSGVVGTLIDAKGFASNMINQGMHFAYASCMEGGVGTVWLTTWEGPEEGPTWPVGVEVLESESHDGVQVGTPPYI